MKIKSLFTKDYSAIYILFLILISFSINQYYAFIGVLPVDSFSTFNSGYDLLNGSIPFKDYWIIKGPVLDIIQAIYFKLFGVSWFSYAAHASTFNSLFAVATFFTLRKFDLELKYAFYYSVLASALMYPTYGTPFTDHHVSIFSMMSIYASCLAIKTRHNIYWFFIPILQLTSRLTFIIMSFFLVINKIPSLIVFLDLKIIIIILIFLIVMTLTFIAAKNTAGRLIKVTDQRFSYIESYFKNTFSLRLLLVESQWLKIANNKLCMKVMWSNGFANFLVQSPRIIVEMLILFFLVIILINSPENGFNNLILTSPIIMRLLPHIQRIFVIVGQLSAGYSSIVRIAQVKDGRI